MLFNRQFQCKKITKHLFLNKIVKFVIERKKKDTCLTLHDAVYTAFKAFFSGKSLGKMFN